MGWPHVLFCPGHSRFLCVVLLWLLAAVPLDLKCHPLFVFNIHFYLFTLKIYLALPGLPGIEPRPSALGAWSLSHWTTRKSLKCPALNDKFYIHSIKVNVLYYLYYYHFICLLICLISRVQFEVSPWAGNKPVYLS